MPPAPLVALRLTRTFGSRLAVSDLSLAVEAGEVVTLLGPNGAGKTTTMRMLAGLILPSSGHVTLNQTPLTAATADHARHAVGLLTEAPGLWERLSVRLNLLTYARLHGMPEPARAVDAALAQVGLGDRSADLAGSLSKGLKQRVALARALLHQPQILLLDEPTSGLDPASARQVREMILALAAEGRAVLVSTHNLAEAEALSHRIGVLNTRLLALDTPAALRQRLPGAQVVIEVEGAASHWLPALAPLPEVRASAAGTHLTVNFAGTGSVPDVVAALAAAGARILGVVPLRRSLEDVYLDLVGAA